MLDRPRRGVEGVGPALGHEQFTAGVLEGAEVGVDGVDEGAGAGIEVGDVGGPVESAGVVGEIGVDEILQDGDAEGGCEVALL